MVFSFKGVCTPVPEPTIQLIINNIINTLTMVQWGNHHQDSQYQLLCGTLASEETPCALQHAQDTFTTDCDVPRVWFLYL